jgi:hypothetical protein
MALTPSPEALQGVLAEVPADDQRDAEQAQRNHVGDELETEDEAERDEPREHGGGGETRHAVVPSGHLAIILQGVAILPRRMSRNQRIGLLAAAAVVVIVAIVIAVAAGGDDENGTTNTAVQTTAQTTAETAATETSAGEPAGTETAETTEPAPEIFKVDIKGGEPVGGVQDIKVKKGDRVTIVVSADAEDDIHLHGYDIEKPVEPGKPATFKFTANIEGIFEMESHVAEHAGREPLMAKLTVEPD